MSDGTSKTGERWLLVSVEESQLTMHGVHKELTDACLHAGKHGAKAVIALPPDDDHGLTLRPDQWVAMPFTVEADGPDLKAIWKGAAFATLDVLLQVSLRHKVLEARYRSLRNTHALVEAELNALRRVFDTKGVTH